MLWGVATLRHAPRFDAPAPGPPAGHAWDKPRWPSPMDAGSFRQIVGELQARGAWHHAVPRRDAACAASIADVILRAYDFADGKVKLEPLALEDRPVLRLTFVSGEAESDADLRHSFHWHDGEELDDALVSQLGLDDLAPWAGEPPRDEPQRVRRWIDACLVRQRRQYDSGQCSELVAATIVWCKHVAGKIVFAAGDAEASVALAGWAQRLASGDEQPPPYHCPLSNVETYELGLTSDGRIVPRALSAKCGETGRVTLASELELCSATGQLALRELLDTCAVTGGRVLRRVLVPCSLCRQSVAPSAMTGDRCRTCRSLARVRSDDPRMARVLGEYPKLDRWRRWSLAEAHSTYVLSARSSVRQVLLVLHKDTLTTLYAAVAGRIWSPWQEMTQLQRDDLLG
jgi:hypothetical protein